MDEQELMGRALVAAAGLTPQSRWRMKMYDAFRKGGPRLFTRRKDAGEVQEDMVTVQQPLPPRQQSRVFLSNDDTGTGDGPGY